jgi:hypothetical protein
MEASHRGLIEGTIPALPGGTEQKHENFQSGQSLSRPPIKLDNSRMIRNVGASANFLGGDDDNSNNNNNNEKTVI